ncbi:MAG: hypothetical protein ABI162_10655 [Luteolibacter sp.]
MYEEENQDDAARSLQVKYQIFKPRIPGFRPSRAGVPTLFRFQDVFGRIEDTLKGWTTYEEENQDDAARSLQVKYQIFKLRASGFRLACARVPTFPPPCLWIVSVSWFRLNFLKIQFFS